MASNPKWCQSLTVWKGYFETWIRKAEPQEVMEFDVFFDFRAVFGDKAIENELRNHVFTILRSNPRFYHPAASQALVFKAPLRFFGTLVPTLAKAEHQGRIDLKAASMAVVCFARLYCLKQEIQETNTLARLEALARKGLLLASKQQEIARVHESLLRLRLRHQSATIQLGKEPDNLVDPVWLGHIEEAVLKECFKEVDSIQDRIRTDFLNEG
jgi:CBS domain-containing protein